MSAKPNSRFTAARSNRRRSKTKIRNRAAAKKHKERHSKRDSSIPTCSRPLGALCSFVSFVLSVYSSLLLSQRHKCPATSGTGDHERSTPISDRTKFVQ